MTFTHVVKLYRTGYSTVKHFGFREDCEQEAQRLNDQYQTDEYVVEDYIA